MSPFRSDRTIRRDEERPPAPANQDRLEPDQIDRLRMLRIFGSAERAKHITALAVCAMRGDFDDDR
jgi:hypothetical protein